MLAGAIIFWEYKFVLKLYKFLSQSMLSGKQYNHDKQIKRTAVWQSFFFFVIRRYLLINVFFLNKYIFL
jgi:hypothetical protein